MAAAATASALYADAALWANHDYDYAATQTYIAPGSGNNAGACARALVNLAQNSPLTFAVQLAGDVDNIYVVHSLTSFPSVVGHATPFDDQLVVLLGNDYATASALTFPASVLTRVNNINAYNKAYLEGPNGHAAAPPAFRHPRVATGTTDTNALETRSLVRIPPSIAQHALTMQANGCYSNLGFYTHFILPGLTAGGADADLVEPLMNWFRIACMGTAAGDDHSPVEVTPTTSPLPLPNQALQSWVSRAKAVLSARLGVGGPGLSTAAFQAGIRDVTQVIQDTNTA